MQFLGIIWRLLGNIQIALSFKSVQDKKGKKREDKRVREIIIRDFVVVVVRDKDPVKLD